MKLLLHTHVALWAIVLDNGMTGVLTSLFSQALRFEMDKEKALEKSLRL